MLPQSFKVTVSKGRKDNNTFSILNYWPVTIPLIILIYAANIYLQAHNDISKYHQDCSNALLSSNSTVLGQPCVYKTASASLEDTYTHRGIRDGQDINLYFPDGSKTFIGIGSVDNSMNYKHLTDVQVNGICQVEIWRGNVTTIINAKHKITSGDNPEQKGSSFVGFMLLVGLFSIILVTACVRFLPIQTAKSQ